MNLLNYLLIALLPIALSSQVAAIELKYTMDMSNPETSITSVTLEISGLITGKTLELCMKKYDWYERFEVVRNIECDGCTVSVKEGRSGCENIIEILANSNNVKVTYNVLNRARDPHGEYESYLGESFGVLDGTFLFLAPLKADEIDIKVSFRLPSGWKVVHVWDENPSPDQLRSLIAVGPFKVIEFDIGDGKGKIAYLDESTNLSKFSENHKENRGVLYTQGLRGT